jgi:CHAD domain-containing protein
VSNTGSHGDRVATRAPSLIWDRFGRVLAHEVDPATAPPAELHRLRISAKKLRYTLETFEEALEPGATLIEQVTALQDAAGAMHDAIVAADRAQTTLDPRDLSADERAAIDAYADGQRREGDRQRSVVAQHLRVVRGRAFRESLGRAVASMGSVAPTS